MASRQDLVCHLKEIAVLARLTEENPHKAEAYSKAAKSIQANPSVIPSKAPGVGASIKKIIKQFKETGSSDKLVEMQGIMRNTQALTGRASDLTKIRGIGAALAMKLIEQGIETASDVITACERGDLHERYLEPAKLVLSTSHVKPRSMALASMKGVRRLLKSMVSNRLLVRYRPAGSLRRRKEFVRDVDILVQPVEGSEDDARDKIVSVLEKHGEVILNGAAKVRALLPYGDAGDQIQVDILFTTQRAWGSALNYFTGSKEHNVAIRAVAKERGFTVNEYGVFRGDIWVAGSEEQDIYQILGFPFPPAWARESQIFKHHLPDKVVPVWDCHVHTKASDGLDTVYEMARQAKNNGLSGFVVTDHGGGTVKGSKLVDERTVRKYLDYVKKASSRSFSALAGMELDVNVKGQLIVTKQMAHVIRELDVVTLACHKDPNVDPVRRFFDAIRVLRRDLSFRGPVIIAHPTGYLHGQRDHAVDDWPRFFGSVSRMPNTYLEINGVPDRCDLNTEYAAQASKAGCKFALGSDAHSVNELGQLANAGWIASRAGIPAHQIWKPSQKKW